MLVCADQELLCKLPNQGHQAQLANDARKGVVNGAKDAGVAELTETLNALSIAASATRRPGRACRT